MEVSAAKPGAQVSLFAPVSSLRSVEAPANLYLSVPLATALMGKPSCCTNIHVHR